ncbi:hypothetical protein EOD41_19540 [Mucilaginibacter limnophilus]|uniref:Thioredoxin family protein n=1 Tax=Mucilaginibacter limnophilus TaxID=1932778 RepID=A0A3S2ULQ2_9SPHI|nr:hypothetical protein [Mucilaginibacter limnophilus]RVT97201.1 hypothetical protein EOD41_19540 [Mucilaginibacter limnophilus]
MKAKFTCVYFTAILAITIICGCGKKEPKDIEADYLVEYVKELHLQNNVKLVLILPGLGCHGCIEEGELFMKDMANNKNINFVLTKVESLKILQGKTGVNVKDHNNIIVDTDDRINVPTDNQIYPCVIHVKNGQFVSHEFQSPDNFMALANIKKQIEDGKLQ